MKDEAANSGITLRKEQLAQANRNSNLNMKMAPSQGVSFSATTSTYSSVIPAVNPQAKVIHRDPQTGIIYQLSQNGSYIV